MSVIALVHDQGSALAMTRHCLEADGHAVHAFVVARNGEQVLAELVALHPDLVVFARDMPGMDGPDMLRRLRPRLDVPAMLWTSCDPADIGELYGLKVAFDEIVTIPVPLRFFAQRVRAVIRRRAVRAEAAPSPEQRTSILLIRDLTLDPERQECWLGGAPIDLGLSEFFVLEALARRPGVVMNRDALLDAVYGDADAIDTINGHLRNVRKKLRQVDPDFEGIETLYGVGYRMKAD